MSEDRLEGKISDRNYTSLSSRYEDEQIQLDERIGTIKNRLEQNQTASDNAELWVSKIKEYAEITELTAPLLNALIDRVTTGEAEIISGERYQNVNIYYRFIGNIE